MKKEETVPDLSVQRPLVGSEFYYEYTKFDQNDAITSTSPDTLTVVRNNVPFLGRFNLLYLQERTSGASGTMFLAYDSNGNISFTTTSNPSWMTYPTGIRNRIVTRDSSVQDILGMAATIHTTTIDSFKSITQEMIGDEEYSIIHVLRTKIDSTAYPDPSQDSKPPVTRVYYDVSFAPKLGIWTSVDIRQETMIPPTPEVRTVHYRLKMTGYKLANPPAEQEKKE